MTVPTRRPVVGSLLLAVGAVHVGLTPVLYPNAVRGVLQAAVVNAIESDPEQTATRSLGFWFATTGVGLMAFGWAVSVIERQARQLPRALPLVLLGIGTWGLVMMPASPFWVFPVLAVVAEVRRRSSRA